jgi:Raf kinase inhibitor-like YbhB/YbcL family protein
MLLAALELAVMMQITSPAFPDQGDIPSRYTCDGADEAPALNWTGVPAAARSLVLIVDDPDAPDPKAPKMTWVHWVLYNLPPASGGLPGGRKGGELPAGTRVGLNDWKRADWGGPCPPIGRHRYYFKLYALDTVLPDLGHVTKAQLEQAISGHVLAEARLMGGYQH